MNLVSLELASIVTNLAKIAARAAADEKPLVAELTREMTRLCAVVQKLEEACKVPAEAPQAGTKKKA